MLTLYAYDVTGREGQTARGDVVAAKLAAKGVPVNAWTQGPLPRSAGGDLLVLAHSTDLSKQQKEDLVNSAHAGAVVVLYTGGSIRDSEAKASDGRIHTLRWVVLRDVLCQLPHGFDLGTFERVLASVKRRDVLVALAVLSFCVTHPRGATLGVEKQQRQWTEDDKKWRKVFAHVKREEFLKACRIENDDQWPARLDELRRFTLWMWPRPKPSISCERPDFSEVLKELQKEFGWRI